MLHNRTDYCWQNADNLSPVAHAGDPWEASSFQTTFGIPEQYVTPSQLKRHLRQNA
jgi:hypothetical protein